MNSLMLYSTTLNLCYDVSQWKIMNNYNHKQGYLRDATVVQLLYVMPEVVHGVVGEDRLGMSDELRRIGGEALRVDSKGARGNGLHAELPADLLQLDLRVFLQCKFLDMIVTSLRNLSLVEGFHCTSTLFLISSSKSFVVEFMNFIIVFILPEVKIGEKVWRT